MYTELKDKATEKMMMNKMNIVNIWEEICDFLFKNNKLLQINNLYFC